MATTKRNDDSAPIFAKDLGLVYKPPSSSSRRFIWHCRMLFESTFALSMLEGWEKILVVTLMSVFWGLVITGIYRYLPYHLEFLYRRAVYYLLGTEQASAHDVGATVLFIKASRHIFTAEL
ncbi:hypothetical protein EDB84DRAFT_1563456 [Lactarius hengduanensis]|nr:hypothetical protein EDB84DRAFT_1563456 [Lactarius hengduanensis]